MSDARLRDAQRTFAALLAHPLVTVRTDPALYRALQRHHKHIADSARRLGYRVQHVGRATRLLRLPLLGEVTAPPPPREAPTRRVLALACVLAAACEEIEGGVTLQKLSDLVHEITATSGKRIAPFDPDQLSHRRQLVRAAAVLEEWGVLHRRALADRLEAWTETHAGIGAGFQVDRDALLLFLSPEVVNQVTLQQDSGDVEARLEARTATRSTRLMRALVETPAVLYADLAAVDPRDADDLRSTRGFRAIEANHTVGGQVEARREGLVMLIVDDAARCPVTVDWPTAAAGPWLSLVVADMAGRVDGVEPDTDTGVVTLTSREVDDVVADFLDWRGEYLPKQFRDSPDAVRAEAERQLCHLGLLRIAAADAAGSPGWLLQPVAGRYRDPDIVLPDAPAADADRCSPADDTTGVAPDSAPRDESDREPDIDSRTGDPTSADASKETHR